MLGWGFTGRASAEHGSALRELLLELLPSMARHYRGLLVEPLPSTARHYRGLLVEPLPSMARHYGGHSPGHAGRGLGHVVAASPALSCRYTGWR